MSGKREVTVYPWHTAAPAHQNYPSFQYVTSLFGRFPRTGGVQFHVDLSQNLAQMPRV